MKRTLRTLVMAVMMIASCATAFAQQDNAQRPNPKQRLSREQLAEKQAQHIASELALSDDVTAKFVKTYCEYQKEIWALGPRPRPDKKPAADKKPATEKENEERIKQRFEKSEKILDIRQKYYKKYSHFLTQTQIEKVYEQERKMMERLAKHGPRKDAPKHHNK